MIVKSARDGKPSPKVLSVLFVLFTVACGVGRGSSQAPTPSTAPTPPTAPTVSIEEIPSVEPTRHPAITLNKVGSFEYLIAEGPGSPGIYAAISSSRVDLIILGGGSYDAPFDRAIADPTGNKLVFSYLDIAEAADYWSPDLFTGKALPDWFGHQNPGYPGLYTVQYWNPAWKSIIFSNIDKIIANGYDGIFLDVLDGNNEWSSGNAEGNPVYPDATSAMATLLSEIRAHIKSKYPNRTFYLMGNNPSEIALQFPNALKNLDAIFNEWVYYGQKSTNGSESEYKGASSAFYILSTLAPLYQSADIPIFGGDYPTPLTDPSAVLLSFEFYTSLGWVPSVTTPDQTLEILATGPFMFMATPFNTTVTGYPNSVNYLSGGQTASATLIGGNQGDYFIGGPGQNTIEAGAGNDTIYAHPKNAAYKNRTVIHLSSQIKNNATTPSVSILVNGQVVVQPTPITVTYEAGTQEFVIDTTPYSSISSVALKVTGANFIDMNNYSNVIINDMIFNGRPVDLSAGRYSSGGSSPGWSYSGNGTVVFPGSAFTSSSTFLTDTSDVIDGGGGVNTVIYRGPYSDYSIAQQPDGSWIVKSATTAEGPDRLTNIQKLVFSDKEIDLPPQ